MKFVGHFGLCHIMKCDSGWVYQRHISGNQKNILQRYPEIKTLKAQCAAPLFVGEIQVCLLLFRWFRFWSVRVVEEQRQKTVIVKSLSLLVLCRGFLSSGHMVKMYWL